MPFDNKSPIWNLPNILTLLRIASIPILVSVLFSPSKSAGFWAAIIFAIGFLINVSHGDEPFRIRLEEAVTEDAVQMPRAFDITAVAADLDGVHFSIRARAADVGVVASSPRPNQSAFPETGDSPIRRSSR